MSPEAPPNFIATSPSFSPRDVRSLEKQPNHYEHQTSLHQVQMESPNRKNHSLFEDTQLETPGKNNAESQVPLFDTQVTEPHLKVQGPKSSVFEKCTIPRATSSTNLGTYTSMSKLFESPKDTGASKLLRNPTADDLNGKPLKVPRKSASSSSASAATKVSTTNYESTSHHKGEKYNYVKGEDAGEKTLSFGVTFSSSSAAEPSLKLPETQHVPYKPAVGHFDTLGDSLTPHSLFKDSNLSQEIGSTPVGTQEHTQASTLDKTNVKVECQSPQSINRARVQDKTPIRVDPVVNGTSIKLEPGIIPTSTTTPKTRIADSSLEVAKDLKQLVVVKSLPSNKTVTEDIVEPINRWWEQLDADFDINNVVSYEKETIHWDYLEHNGMIFTPEYVPHKVPISYKGVEYVLEPRVEEVATFWAQSIGTNYETSDIYRKNFWNLFIDILGPKHPIVKSKAKLEDLNFEKIQQHLLDEKQRKKDNKEYFQVLKQQQNEREYPFSYALVDWIREKVSSNKLEPPGLFKGRGLHPKQGLLKSRVMPEEVILNMSKDAPVPKITMFERDGHSWGDIFHDNTVTWLAFYKDSINDQYKYMYLAAQSKFKGLHDFLKYNKARELKQYIEKIRVDYKQKMASEDVYLKQLGTATYLIDFLALRVGGEKDQDEADTVGCCSLRVEHIKFENRSNYITLDFLGKDSIRYFSTVKIDEIACRNLKSFCKGKKGSTDIFHLITTQKLNDYLKELMPGLSAKIFRTYNASYTLDKQLRCLQFAKSMASGIVLKPKEVPANEKPRMVNVGNLSEIVSFYNDANRKVAILCNHQRAVPKQHESSMSRMQLQKEAMLEEIEELEAYADHLAKEKKAEFHFKIKAMDHKGNFRKPATRPGMKLDQCNAKLTRAKAKLKDHCIKMKMKDDNKTVALGTSKINYMDPRITVAFCKRFEVPIEKIFNKSLRSKFPWAMYASADFVF